MHTVSRLRCLVTVGTILLSRATQLGAQQLPPPDLQIADARARAARVLDSIAGFEPAMRPTYVRSDTTRGGVTWIDVEPMAVPRAQRARTPEAAAAGFLARYGAKVYGVDPELGRLELLRVQDDGHLRHLRYVQRHAGYPVLYGQLIVHVVQLPGGWAVKSANGWVFPDIVAPTIPNLSRSGAETAALFGLNGASTSAAQDTAPVIVAHEGRYRLAYLIRVSSDLFSATRYVDAVSGGVFAESAADRELAGTGSLRPPAVANLPARRAHSPEEPGSPSVRSASIAGFETAQGFEWQGPQRAFRVWNTGSTYELRDDGHPGASEIRIYDFDNTALGFFCGPGTPGQIEPIVARGSLSWPDDPSGREEVSAVHNLGESVSYFKNTFGRNGMAQTGGPLVACVDGAETIFYSAYDPYNGALKFRRETGTQGPSAAARDVVTHEFTHGVTHTEVNFGTGLAPTSVDEGLADFFGARHNNNERCFAKGVIHATQCLGGLNFSFPDSITPCELRTPASDPTALSPHCQGIRLSAGLLTATEASSGAFAGKVDSVVYSALQAYMTPSMDLYDAAYAMIYFARQVGHQGAYPPYTSMYNASPALESGFLSSLLHGHPPVTVQMAPSYGFTLTISPTFYVYDITFEIGTQGQGFNYDGSIQWPDSEIPLAEDHYYEGPIAYGQDELDWHSCSDGHAHGFRVTVNAGPNSHGPLTYYTAMSGCGGSLMAGPAPTDALPRKFAVRQAMQTSNGIVSASIVGSGGQPGSLGAQVRQYGLTALEVDVPINTVPAPIEMTVYNPQGRVIRRLVTAPIGPGTERVPWDRKNDRGEQAPPGVYVVLVNHGSYRHRTHFIIPAVR